MPASPTYPWTVSVPRWNSAIGLTLSFIFLAILAIALIANHGLIRPLILDLAVWLFILVACYAAFSFTRRLLNPPLALAADEAGLVVFYRRYRGDYAQPGVVVPWSAIESLGYESYTVKASSRTRIYALVVVLHPHNAVPLDQLSIRTAENRLYVDLWSKSTATKVLDDLRAFRQRPQ